MKLVFIHPPTPSISDRKVSPPLGILYLAAYLREKMKDLEIKVIDQNLIDDPNLATYVREAVSEPADVYAVSFGTTQYSYAVAISRALKETYPEAVIICGGVHASVLPQETLEDTNCDFVCLNEGEITLYELVKALSNRENDYLHISNLHYKDKGGQRVFTTKRNLIKNLNELPFPARDLVKIGEYSKTINNENAANVITARGCPGKCIFCSQDIWENRPRLRSVDNIIAEIDQIKKLYRIKNILFLDDTLTSHRTRILDLCEKLKTRGIIWRGWTRANYIDEKLAQLMRNSGCESLCIGIESGSQKILDSLRKKITVEQNYNAMMAIKRAGINARASLIVGSPGETWDTLNETLNFMEKIQPDDWLVNIFTPLPGSESFTYPERFGIHLLKNEATNMEFYDKFMILEAKQSKHNLMDYDNLPYSEIIMMHDYLNDELKWRCAGPLYREDKKGFMFF
jgi:anaerobic magnesium-protoporphyrin IX monomethyl ester cyclase